MSGPLSSRLSTRQKGVTLLEVLVGFVIFCSSLVAVLDYVSGHIYHYQLSVANMLKVQLVYDWSVARHTGAAQLPPRAAGTEDFDMTVAESVVESFPQPGNQEIEIALNRYSYEVRDTNNTLSWTVIEFN